jgi:hypothetical protein
LLLDPAPLVRVTLVAQALSMRQVLFAVLAVVAVRVQ